MLKGLFTKHPRSIGETYLQHLCYAMIQAFRLIFSGFALLIHSIFPFLFEFTASNTINKLSKKLAERKEQGQK